MSIKKNFYRALYKDKLIPISHCTDEENQKFANMTKKELPDNVDAVPNNTPKVFMRYSKGGLSDEELKLFTLEKINSNLKTVKGCIIFFVVLAIISAVLTAFGLVQVSSALHSAFSNVPPLFG